MAYGIRCLNKELTMQHFKKFKVYQPQDTDKKLLVNEFGVMFLKNDDGLDWYDCRSSFRADTLKIGYADNGRVATLSMDVDALMPVDLAVAELPATQENMRVALGDDWFYIDGKLSQNIDYTGRAESKKTQLLSNATTKIAPLQDAEDLGIATDEEAALLQAWKNYRVLLNRVDTSTAPDVKWPTPPVDV